MKGIFITLTALAVFGTVLLAHVPQANAGFSFGFEIGPRYVAPPPPPPAYAYVPVYEPRYYYEPYPWYPPRVVEFRDRYWHDGYYGCGHRGWGRRW